MPRILVVDDNEDAREITRLHLNAAGYREVATAGSGEEALELLSGDEPYDAALLDVLMDGIDGIETCARIRTDPRHADLPILMVTSMADGESLSQAFVAGATDYIVKPLRRMELTARLRAALRSKAELDRRRAREAELLAGLALADGTTRLATRAVLEPMLAAAARGSLLVVARLVRGDLDDAGWAAARRDAAAALAAVPAPLGSLLADLGDGRFAALLPPGSAPEPIAAVLAGRLRLGSAVTDDDGLAALAAAERAAEG